MNNYVLIFVDADNRPQYLQGTITAINTELKKLWENGDIDREDWDFNQPWDLLVVRGGMLVEVENAAMGGIPQLEEP